MLFKLFAFLIFLSPLVFFHELGHYLFARLFGVRVEIFSIGFGKTLFSWKKGDTDYRFSLIPLGGYVKMYGENLLNKDEIPASQRDFAYNHKSKWARFWIIFGGPLANFILAFFLYFFLVVKGEEVREFKVAEIPKESLMSQAGFQMGDIIKKINGEFFYTQEDMIFLDEEDNKFEVQRNEELIELKVSEKPEKLLEDYLTTASYLINPVFYNSTGEKVIVSHVNDFESSQNYSYQEIERKIKSKIYLFLEKDKSLLEIVEKSESKSFLEILREKGLYRNDIFVNRVMENSPASKSGLKDKTLITKVGDKRILAFKDLRTALEQGQGKDVDIEFIDLEGKKYSKRVTPKENIYGDKKVYTIGIESGLLLHRGKKIQVPGQGFVQGARSAYKRTKIAFIKTYTVLKDMIFGKADVWNNLGGPIAIANVASSSLMISLEFFLRFMAIMSINLGLMNLLPIPVLDGGHITFIFLEIINRGSLSRGKVEFAQKVGLTLLLGLMIFVIANDIIRFLF